MFGAVWRTYTNAFYSSDLHSYLMGCLTVSILFAVSILLTGLTGSLQALQESGRCPIPSEVETNATWSKALIISHKSHC